MFKKFIYCFSIFILLFNFTNVNAYEKISYSPFYAGDTLNVNKSIEKENANLDIKAKSAILIEGNTGNILYENNSDEKLPPASITKIMTLLLVMEELDEGTIKLEDKVTVSEHANSMGGSQIWLEVGEQMSVDDLLKATAIASANDAAVALAEFIGTSEDEFVNMMNAKAKQLGMTNTTFKNATGLDAEGHLTTARDISTMSKALLKHNYILKYTKTWMDTLRGGETQLVNTNKLIRFYEGSTGLKTGTTEDAGSCLSASAERNGLKLIAVVMGCQTSDDRFSSAKTLLDYGFSKFEAIVLDKTKTGIDYLEVKNGIKENVKISSNIKDNVIIIPKGQKQNIKLEVQLAEYVTAPVQKNQTVGKILVKLNNNIISSYDIVTNESVNIMKFYNAFDYVLKALFKN